jgi:hypothetical protein
MRRSHLALIAAVLVASLVAQKAFALAMETKGNEPMSELNFPGWKGIIEVINHKSRVYGLWVNGDEILYYKGGTKELNAALAAFARVEMTTHIIVVRPGPAKDRQSFDRKAVPFNWELHVVGGIARRMARNDTQDLYWHKNPVLTVHVGGDIDLSKVEAPKGLTWVTGKATTEKGKEDAALAKQIAEFVDARNREAKK